jgi:excisionase family DNA binding protein
MTKSGDTREELIDVSRAAVLAGRHPETVRRWVWSGRLSAQRQGRRLLVARSEVQAMVGQEVAASSLRDWADLVRVARGSVSSGSSGRTAADLVIEDREHRSEGIRPRARR